MNKSLNYIKNIIFILLLGILVFFSLALFSQRTRIGGYSTYVVLSGSMKPAFDAGDMVITKTANDGLSVGDIISFNDPNIPRRIITHRIVKVDNKNNETYFTTRGDANKDPDQWSITKSNVLGKIVFSIPKVGYIVEFSKSKTGFVLLILLPGLFIIISELASLAGYIKKLETKSKDNVSV